MSSVRIADFEYPTSDGKPMAETDYHRKLIIEIIEKLDGLFADRPDVYVSGNLLVFYEEGDLRKHLSPDVFLVFAVPKRDRLSYKIWEEGKAPELVIEVTSKSTKREDLKEKFLIYQDVWKAKEYFLFDPLGEYLDPPMRGYRLVRGKYKRIEPDANDRLPSRLLGLDLERQESRLVFRDRTTGREILRPDRQRNLELQAEVEQLRQELDALRQQRPKSPRHRRNGL
jgi:Uma2 family endonuclease